MSYFALTKNIKGMITNIIISLVGLFTTITSSMVTFLLTKKKYNAEVDRQVIENLQ